MKVLLKWVNELVNIETIELEKLIEKLTFSGFEVEEIIQVDAIDDKQFVLDISTTANRPDTLSIKGISTEIATLLNKPIRKTKYLSKSLNFNWLQKFNKSSKLIKENSCCSTFITIIIKNLTDLTSPKWLKKKLLNSGITPENNLVDFQVYILLETGYPFELYDLKRIFSENSGNNSQFKLSDKKNVNKFLANNGLYYHLEKSPTLNTTTNVPIGIAGIIPAKESTYSNKTDSLMIEGSVFKSAKIRQELRKLGLRTDRASKYEKAIKATYLVEACYCLVSLLRLSNPQLSCKLHTNAISEQIISSFIQVRYTTIKNILGPVKKKYYNSKQYISLQLIPNFLKRLKFEINYGYYNNMNISNWKVYIPELRNSDIVDEIDVIEEIGRLYGFNNFLSQLPPKKKTGLKDDSYKTRVKITFCLTNLGLTEFVHYSLTSKKNFSLGEIQLKNPLTLDYSILRISLLPYLIRTVETNLKQGNLFLEGFEHGHVFSKTTSASVQEEERVAGIFGNTKKKTVWFSSTDDSSWLRAKGKMEQVFEKLKLSVVWQDSKMKQFNSILHPYCTSTLLLKDNIILGIFGKINPTLAKKMNLPADLYLFEFNLSQIQNYIETRTLPKHKNYSFYPKIVKNLSFIVLKNVSFETIKKILYFNGSKFLTQITLLDKYEKNIPSNSYTSLCLQLVFQSNKETLQNKKIDSLVDKLKDILSTEFQVVFKN